MNTRPRILKIITIALSPLYTPLGVWIGFCLGVENYSLAIVGIFITMFMSIIDSIIFWKLIRRD